MLVLIINFFSLKFTSIEMKGERVSSTQNERTFRGGCARKHTKANKRGGGRNQNSGILSERTFWISPKSKLDNSFLKQSFVKICKTHLDHHLKDAGYFICVSIKSFKKSFLKYVCNDVYDFLSSKADSFLSQQWYGMTLGVIESRIYNPPASKTTKTKPKSVIKL